MNQRLREFDFIRAFAALSVIAIHVSAGYLQVSTFAYGWNQAMRYAVPLFIILSGFLLYYVDQGRPPLPYGQFLKKRLQKVVWPYLSWNLFYFLYSNHANWPGWQQDMWQPFRLFWIQTIKGTGYVHLYFVLIVIQLYICYPLLRRWLERHPSTLLLSALVLTGLGQTFIYLHQIGVLALPSLWIPYVSMLPLWLFYFVFGMVAAFYRNNWEEKLRQHFPGVLLSWCVAIILLIGDSLLTATHASSIKPSVILYAVTSYLCIYRVALFFTQTTSLLGRWLDWLSLHSFMIFLIHPFFLSVWAKKFPALWGGNKGMILLFLATTLSSILFTYLFSKIPVSTWLGGVYQKKGPRETGKPVQVEAK